MERTSNFIFTKKNKSRNYKSSNYISNQNATKNIETNFNSNQNKTQNINFSRTQSNPQTIAKNQNQSVNFSRTQYNNRNSNKYRPYNSNNFSQTQHQDKIEHQASDIVSLNTQNSVIRNEDIVIKDASVNNDELLITQNKNIAIKQDFSISYKDKTYTYIIPETVLKKEKELLPFWLHPIQVRLIPNDSSTFDFCNEVFIRLSQTGARVEIDNKQDNIAKKIKNAELDKIPYIIVIGPKEKSIHKFIVRYFDGSQKLLSVGAFYHVLEEQLDNKPKSKINYT